MPSAKYGLTVSSVHRDKSKKVFGPMLKIEILNRPPTTMSKLMESEDPEEPTYGSAWRRKPYLLTAGTLAPPVESVTCNLVMRNMNISQPINQNLFSTLKQRQQVGDSRGAPKMQDMCIFGISMSPSDNAEYGYGI